jgi:RNA polymerase sigma-70 factor (ECF subfamily)
VRDSAGRASRRRGASVITKRVPLDDATERAVAAARARGDEVAAADALVRGYGAEVYGFLVAMLRNDDDAEEAFASFSEEVVRSLPTFRGASTFRTWSYAVARHAALRLRRGEGRRRKRFVDGATGAAERVAFEMRSATTVFRRSDVKDRVRALRDALSDDERELLVLRIDRGLEWDEVASVLNEESATLRKRFERTKEKLRVLAQQAGLLE